MDYVNSRIIWQYFPKILFICCADFKHKQTEKVENRDRKKDVKMNEGYMFNIKGSLYLMCFRHT